MLITRNCSPQETTQAKPHCGSGQGFSFARRFATLSFSSTHCRNRSPWKGRRKRADRLCDGPNTAEKDESCPFVSCLAKTEASKGAEQIDKLIYCQHASEYQQLTPAESTWKGQRNFYTHLNSPVIDTTQLSLSLVLCKIVVIFTTRQLSISSGDRTHRRGGEISENLCFQLPFAFMAFDIFPLLLHARRLCVIDGSILWVEFATAAVVWCWGETKQNRVEQLNVKCLTITRLVQYFTGFFFSSCYCTSLLHWMQSEEWEN